MIIATMTAHQNSPDENYMIVFHALKPSKDAIPWHPRSSPGLHYVELVHTLHRATNAATRKASLNAVVHLPDSISAVCTGCEHMVYTAARASRRRTDAPHIG